MKRRGWLLLAALWMMIGMCVNAGAEGTPDALTCLRTADEVWWYGTEWAMTGFYEDWTYSEYCLVNLKTGTVRLIEDSQGYCFFAADGETYLMEADKLTRLWDDSSLTLSEGLAIDYYGKPLLADGAKVISATGRVVDLKAMTVTAPREEDVSGIYIPPKAACYGHACVGGGQGYFDWLEQRVVHSEIEFVATAGTAQVLDGYAFGNRKNEDGSSQAVAVCLDTGEVTCAFDGIWYSGSFDAKQSNIYSDGTGLVCSETGRDDYCVVNWRTGQVLTDADPDCFKHPIDPNVWCWWVNEQEKEYYLDVLTGVVTEERPLTEAQQRLAEKGEYVSRTYDDYYVDIVCDEQFDLYTLVYDAQGELLFETYDVPGDLYCSIFESYHGNGGLFCQWAYWDIHDMFAVVTGVKGEDGAIYWGAYSREEGQVLSPVFEKVFIEKDVGFIALLDGEWQLYDKHGNQLY